MYSGLPWPCVEGSRYTLYRERDGRKPAFCGSQMPMRYFSTRQCAGGSDREGVQLRTGERRGIVEVHSLPLHSVRIRLILSNVILSGPSTRIPSMASDALSKSLLETLAHFGECAQDNASPQESRPTVLTEHPDRGVSLLRCFPRPIAPATMFASSNDRRRLGTQPASRERLQGQRYSWITFIDVP